MLTGIDRPEPNTAPVPSVIPAPNRHPSESWDLVEGPPAPAKRETPAFAGVTVRA
jgi:hypothetical protein